jgi:hypothetical protein
MSDQTTVDVASSQDDAVQSAVLAAQMAIIDAAVRQARNASWCGEFERIMDSLFPEGPPDGSKEYVDSDGWSCRGLDRDGFDRDGMDRDGYDRDGYHRETGRDRSGFDRDGLHSAGYRRDSDEYRARFRFNRFGRDRDGFDRRGRNQDGLTREQISEHGESLFVYEWDDRRGLLSVEGRDIDGYATDGTYREPSDYALMTRLRSRY